MIFRRRGKATGELIEKQQLVSTQHRSQKHCVSTQESRTEERRTACRLDVRSSNNSVHLNYIRVGVRAFAVVCSVHSQVERGNDKVVISRGERTLAEALPLVRRLKFSAQLFRGSGEREKAAAHRRP
jgi:hypothetical protein